MKFTDRTLAGLPLPARGQRLYSDDTLHGFGVRVSQGGARTFVLTLGADRNRIVIGRYPIVSLAQARNKARTLMARRQLGLEKPPSPPLGEICEAFLRYREDKIRATSYRKEASRLKVFTPLAKKRIAEIEPEEVQAILDTMPAPSTRHESYVRFCLLVRYAIKRRYISSWPLEALDDDFERGARERVLSDEELATVVHTARIWRLGGHEFGTIVELLAYTGQRRQQIGSLHRSLVDFDAGTITWPPDLMKAGRKHMIPIGDQVRSILEPRRVNALYFPNKYGEPWSFSSLQDRMFRADCGFSDWTLHDLRRTFATHWQEMGIDIPTTEKMLSHSAVTGGLVGLYQRSTYLTSMKIAVHRWEDRLHELLLNAIHRGNECQTAILQTSSNANATASAASASSSSTSSTRSRRSSTP